MKIINLCKIFAAILVTFIVFNSCSMDDTDLGLLGTWDFISYRYTPSQSTSTLVAKNVKGVMTIGGDDHFTLKVRLTIEDTVYEEDTSGKVIINYPDKTLELDTYGGEDSKYDYVLNYNILIMECLYSNGDQDRLVFIRRFP